MKNIPRNIHTKFGSNWSGSVRREYLEEITLKIEKNVEKGQ